MDFIDKVFKPLLLLAVGAWMVLAITQTLTNSQLMVYAGILFVCMGVRNLLILNVSYHTKHFHEKIQAYIDQFGLKKGLIRYSIILVATYLILGILLIIFNI